MYVVTPSVFVICRSAEEGGGEVAVGVKLGGGLDVGGLGVTDGGGKNIGVLVGTEVSAGVLVVVVTTIFVAVGEFVVVETGIGVEKDAPGVRKTSIQAGFVRMEGSRGSIKPLGTFVRKSLSGLRFDPMLESSLQLGARRSAHPLERIIHMNPNSRMSSISRRESRLSFSRSRVCMETSIYRKTHEYGGAGIGFFVMTRALQPDASPMSIDDTT